MKRQKIDHNLNIGKKFGKLEVLRLLKQTRYIKYDCSCECGRMTTHYANGILNGNVKSCGLCETPRTVVKPRKDIKRGNDSSGANYVYLTYKRNADQRGYSFELTKDEFINIATKNCTYCGVGPKQVGRYSGKKNSPIFFYNGVDRRNNEDGYTLSNAVPCCNICNKAKGTLTEPEFKEWITNLTQFQTKDKIQIIKNDMIVCTDIDDTLVMWDNVKWWEPGDGLVEFHDPTDSSRVYLKPHKAHINLLKKYKAQGYTIIAWSAGGYRWASAVVEALGLTNIVNIAMSKPLKYIDDLKGPEGVIGARVYIPFEQVNKIIEPAIPDDEIK